MNTHPAAFSSTTAPSRGRIARRGAGALLGAAALVVAPLGGLSHAATDRPTAENSSASLRDSVSRLSARQILRLATHPDDRVIVILRRSPGIEPSGRMTSAQNDELRSEQAPVVQELRAVSAHNVHAYNVIDAVSATVSHAEAHRLARQPGVKAVLPDGKVTLPSPTAIPAYGTASSATGASADAIRPRPDTEPGACASGTGVETQPEALSLITPNDEPRSIDGSGVKIAVFPDGVDPDNSDFMRGGTSAVGDYRDFTGEGLNAKTGGGEAFGDVSSIVSQGTDTFDLSQYVDPSMNLQSPCNINIKGIAPGATVDVMKVFGDKNQSFDSTLLQGMDWAVSHDHVNILSESFGANTVPQPSNDPISLFNDQAVKDGILVVSSSGDSGTTNTVAAPASSAAAGELAVGATTALQASAQVGTYGANLPSAQGGWESNNIASLSSTGDTDYGPSTVDVVAPGDSGWADCSTDYSEFPECRDPYNTASGRPAIELFGGTSESAPLTAGTAALVIQAYEVGQSAGAPSPELVKRIITSTATPIPGAPANEQGAGLINAVQALQMAYSLGAGGASTGLDALLSTDRISKVGNPGQKESVSLKVTNESSSAQTFTPEIGGLRPPTKIAGSTFTYQAGAPGSVTAPDPVGNSDETYIIKSFTVPSGTSRLAVSASWSQTGKDANRIINAALIDPSGKIVNDTDPQGYTNYGQIEASDPAPGTWQVAFDSLGSGYKGPVTWNATTQTIDGTAGTAATVQPGATQNFTESFRLPSSAGDEVKSFGITNGTSTSAIPVLGRARIPVSSSRTGKFSGTLTGGNGRQFDYSQLLPYELAVPSGVKDIDVNLDTSDSTYPLLATLVDPKGQAVDSQSNIIIEPHNRLGTTSGIHIDWATPIKGEWHLDVAVLGGGLKDKTSASLSGTVSFGKSPVKVSGVPDSKRRKLARGKLVKAKVTVKNPTKQAETIELDPRSSTMSDVKLEPITRHTTGTLPISSASSYPIYALPPFAKVLAVVAKASKPIAVETFQTIPDFGTENYPDVVSNGFSKQPAVELSGTDLPSGAYACAPTLKGPSATAAPKANFACGAAARTLPIAKDVTTSTGDLWATTGSFHPVTIGPGKKATITVTIKPSAKKGTKESGFIAVESFDSIAFGTNVIAKIPYAFTSH